jgi:hypothetical protein
LKYYAVTRLARCNEVLLILEQLSHVLAD